MLLSLFLSDFPNPMLCGSMHLFTSTAAAHELNSQFQLNPVRAARQKAKVAGVHVPGGRWGSAQAE